MWTFFASEAIFGRVIAILVLLVINALLGYLGIAISDHVRRKKDNRSTPFFFDGIYLFVESIKKEMKGGEKITVTAHGKKLGEVLSKKDSTMFLPGFFILSLVGFLIFVTSFRSKKSRQHAIKDTKQDD